MQGKGLIKFFVGLLVIACLFQLSFTFVTSRIEKKATAYAAAKVSDSPELKDQEFAIRRAYLDSMSSKKVFNILVTNYTYEECKKRELGLGLDLQGGMSVIMQVSLKDLIKNMANNPKDAAFNDALAAAIDAQKTEQKNLPELFVQEFEKANPGKDLITYFKHRNSQDIFDRNDMTNGEVLTKINEESLKAIQRTYRIINERIDKFGVSQPFISLNESTGRITVELPGADSPESVRKNLQATANLEFWETYDNTEVVNYLIEANDIIAKARGFDTEDSTLLDALTGTETETETQDQIAETGEDILDALGLETSIDTVGEDLASLIGDSSAVALTDEETQAAFEKENPLFAKLSPNVFTDANGQQRYGTGSTIGYSNPEDTAAVNRMLASEDVQAVFPRKMKLYWESQPIVNEDDGTSFFRLHAIRDEGSDNKPPLSGEVITKANDRTDQTGQNEIVMYMNNSGAKKWANLTEKNTGKSIAIILDDKVFSAPNVSGKITGGVSSISGDFTIKEAKDLAAILEIGKLPAPAEIIEEAIVGPSMGKESIQKSIRALMLGLILVLVFMVLYYNTAGIIADIALFLNMLFVIGILATLGASLTLPGMAGIILTIGMAVDANVIIFERIREELRKGRAIKQAIADGYKKSYSAIIDANVTTFITGLILLWFGLGPVKGFATILLIGIVSSFITGVLVTRLFVDWRTDKGVPAKFWNGLSKNVLSNPKFDFISKRRIAYLFSGIIIAAGIFSMVTRGFELGVDFKGGRSYVVRFDDAVNVTNVQASLTDAFGERPTVKTFGGDNQVKITTSYLIDTRGLEADSIVEHTLFTGLQPHMKADTDFSTFSKDYRQSSQKVGPTIADDIKKGALQATLFGFLAIFLYILVRFRKWQYGLGALIALIHDVLIVLSMYSLLRGILPFSLEIDQVFIAAILTVIGYSINDTVVVFDRIREYLSTFHKTDLNETINAALNSTLSRTVITSLTTFIVVLILFVLGGEVIRGFAFALLVGIISGTYSSLFIATPVVVDLTKDDDKKRRVSKSTSKSSKQVANV